MELKDYLSEHPEIKADQIISFEAVSENTPLPDASLCALMQWARDEGNYSIWRATTFVNLTVSIVRNGVLRTEAVHGLRPGDEVRILMNLDGRNYDGFRC